MLYTKNGKYFNGIGSVVIGMKRIFNPSHSQLLNSGWKVVIENKQENLIKEYELVVENHINNIAKQNEFDSILTCTKYSGFDNPFRNKAEALLSWNSNCWIKCRKILADVQSGLIPQPTVDELINMLPKFQMK